MKISQATEHAIDALLYMALRPGQKVFLADEVARAMRVSPSYLAKVFQRLARRGLLRGYRGARGGYGLAKEPSEITLLDVVHVGEGDASIFDCGAQARECPLGERCLITKTFRKAESAAFEVLRKVTLKNVCDEVLGSPSSATWLLRKEPIAPAPLEPVGTG
jgi:Rrf2 family protein